jgi:uncharacterized protein (DUF2147 family)
MHKLKSTAGNKWILILIALFLIGNLGCKKVDQALDFALDFEGIFKTSNGWEVTLSESPTNIGRPPYKLGNGTFTKEGNPMPLFTWGLGSEIFRDMEQTNDNTWIGSVTNKDFTLGGGHYNGTITIDGNLLTVKPDNLPSYTLTKVAGSGSGTPGTTQILMDRYVTGNEGDKKLFEINLPSNVKKMEVKAFEESSINDKNLADLGVRKGSAPTVTKTPRYKWEADCASINPNRQDEICRFQNPGSGPWSIMLFGYNSSFRTKLKITLTF